MTKQTVLYIIDDDLDDRDLLIEVLKKIDSSITFVTANNGQDGLKKLDSSTFQTPSIIFLDLNMPKINGRQFLITIKGDPTLKDVPVIIYTTSSNPKDIYEMKKLGAAGYLIKQYDLILLKEKLTTLLSETLLQNFQLIV